MKQRRYSNFLDQDEEFAQFQYHSLISKITLKITNPKIIEFQNFYKNHNDRNQQVNKINTNNNNIEKAKSLKDLKRQNQLYQIGLKFKKITKENFILNQKLVEFKDIFGQCCTCLIGNEVEYPQFQNNEVYYLSGVQIKESLKQNKDFQIMIQKGKITQYPPDEQVQQTKPIEQEQKTIIQRSTLLLRIIQLSINFNKLNSLHKTLQQRHILIFQQLLFNNLIKINLELTKGAIFDFIKVEVMDQDGQLDSITLWNTFLEHKFTPYQIVFSRIQNQRPHQEVNIFKLLTVYQKLQLTIHNYNSYISISQLNFSFYEVKATMTRHLEVIKFKKLISYREILQQNPN